MTEEGDSVSAPIEGGASDVGQDKTETRSTAGSHKEDHPGISHESETIFEDAEKESGEPQEEGTVLSDDALALKAELDKIKVEAPSSK